MLFEASQFTTATADSQPGPSIPTAMSSTTAKPTPVSAVSVVNGKAPHGYPHIWVITGPAGTGKSTLARNLKDAKGWDFLEGDEFHPPANVEKMKNGQPLDDGDRWQWLETLREEAMKILNGGKQNVIITCSALKKRYRNVIRVAGYGNHRLHIHFIYLSVDPTEAKKRAKARSVNSNHYMPPELVQSQYDILEPPKDETDAIVIEASQGPDLVFQNALQEVDNALEMLN